MRLRITGHPLHPAIVHFPVALWLTAVLWDVVGWVRPEPLWWQMAYWSLALGLIAAVPAVITGFLDYTSLRAGDDAQDTATAHMMVMMVAASAFIASFLVRLTPNAAPSIWAIVLSGAGGLFLAIGGWLGGTLVYRYGIGSR